MATLSYASTPELIRSILSYASWDVLVAARLTCKGVEELTRPFFAEQLHLESSMDDELMVDSLDGRVIPGLRSISLNKDTFTKELPNVLRYTKYTRVVELEGFVQAEFNLKVAAPAFPSLDIYRSVTGYEGGFTPYFPFPAKTVVIFFRETGPIPPPDSAASDDFYDEDEPEMPDGVVQRIPNGVERIVVNMSGDDIPVADFYPCIFKFPTSVKDFVIVFPEYKAGKVEGSSYNFTPLIITMDTSELIGTDARYVLVGVDEVTQLDMRTVLREHMSEGWSFREGVDRRQAIEQLMGHVEVLSKAEYAREVGDVDLHVVERMRTSWYNDTEEDKERWRNEMLKLLE